MKIPGLRSPHEKLGDIVYFGRMLDKIRLHAEGKLPEDYHKALGGGFDARCCAFLGSWAAWMSSRMSFPWLSIPPSSRISD